MNLPRSVSAPPQPGRSGFVLAIAFALTHSAVAAEALTPGIYQIEGDSYRSAAATMRERPDEKYVEHFEHAVPSAAKLTYAVVSRATLPLPYDVPQHKLLFLVDKGYQYDANTANRLCQAYAFPGWNFQSDAQPFCRTGIGDSRFEAVIKWTETAFTTSFSTTKTPLRYEFVKPQRKPTAADVGACAMGVCNPEAYGYGINHYTLTHRSDRFTLKAQRPYQDIVYLTKAVPVYAQADHGSAHADIEAGSYVAVLTTDPAWYEIDRFSTDGTWTHGWIDRDDMVDVEWVMQKAATKDHRFRVAFHKDDDDQDTAWATAIEVLDRKTGKRTQVIRDFPSDMRGASDSALQVDDANFDGHPDISIFGYSGGAGPNSTESIFLFDPVSRQFVFNSELSKLSQLSIDPRNKTITAAQRNSCCSHSSQTYKFIGKKLTMVASWDESLSADGNWLETTTGRLINGKMRYRTKRAKAPAD